MKKQIGKNLMQKWKNKIRVRLSALDKKKLVLTNIPYALAAFYADRAFFLYRNSPGEDMGNKLLYAMEHADRIFARLVLSNNWKDLLAGIVVAVVLKVLVWQKQADAKKLRKGIEYGSARWGTAEDLQGPAVFLASEASDFVNGLILYVDGGIAAYIGKQPK